MQQHAAKSNEDQTTKQHIHIQSNNLDNFGHSTAQHSTAQHSTAQHSTAQHSTAQHGTAQHIHQ